MKYVAYYRVSTAKQGRSGLGLQAQSASVEAYVKDSQIVGDILRSRAVNGTITRSSHRQSSTLGGLELFQGRSVTESVRIKVVAVNGNGVQADNENDLSLVATVKFGEFDAVIGGDLSGFKTGNYEDIETSVAPSVGQVEVYKGTPPR